VTNPRSCPNQNYCPSCNGNPRCCLATGRCGCMTSGACM
jgi:hypothetical protein